MDPTLLSGIFGSFQNAQNIAYDAYQSRINREWQSDEAQKNRDWQSSEASTQRDWSSQEAERARDWNEEMYAKYNSLSGKIAQAEQAGVNPMFAITGNAVSPASPSASAPSGASAGSVANPSNPSSRLTGMVDMMAGILNAQRTKQDIATQKAQENLYNAEAERARRETFWMDPMNEAVINEKMQAIKESISRISVNDSTINVNDSVIRLNGTESALNITKQAVENLNVEKARLLLPYVQAREEAEIYLSDASARNQTSLSFKNAFEAEKAIYDANISMLNVLKDQKLIDAGYYDDLIKLAEYEAKGAKRDYKWKPINDVCSNLSDILSGLGVFANGVGNAVGTISGIAKPLSKIGFK